MDTSRPSCHHPRKTMAMQIVAGTVARTAKIRKTYWDE